MACWNIQRLLLSVVTEFWKTYYLSEKMCKRCRVTQRFFCIPHLVRRSTGEGFFVSGWELSPKVGILLIQRPGRPSRALPRSDSGWMGTGKPKYVIWDNLVLSNVEWISSHFAKCGTHFWILHLVRREAGEGFFVSG